MSNENYSDIPSIVPERDEVASHRRKPKKRGSSAPPPPPVRRSSRPGGMFTFLVSVLTVGMIATGVGAYFFYQQNLLLTERLDVANNQIRQIENRLSMVDEAAEQSSMGLLERVDFNFSEIDKLWAARNANRSNIAENQTTLESQGETITSMESVIGSQSSSINENTNRLMTVQTRLDTINGNLRNLETMSAQLNTLSNELNQVKASVSNNGTTTLTNRVAVIEQDIESINVSRLQLNQAVSALRDSVQQLQELMANQP